MVGFCDLNAIGAVLRITATEIAMVDFRERENFFNPYQRQFPNKVSRTYTTLENLIGNFSTYQEIWRGGWIPVVRNVLLAWQDSK